MNTLNIEFPVTIKGKELVATVEENTSNPVQEIFRIRFSDGYVDEFGMDEDDGLIKGCNSGSLFYAQAIEDDFHIISFIKQDKFFHVFQHELNGVRKNIWVIEDERDGNVVYKVYYNSFYHFEFKEEGNEWKEISHSKDETETIEPIIAKRARLLLLSVV